MPRKRIYMNLEEKRGCLVHSRFYYDSIQSSKETLLTKTNSICFEVDVVAAVLTCMGVTNIKVDYDAEHTIITGVMTKEDNEEKVNAEFYIPFFCSKVQWLDELIYQLNKFRSLLKRGCL